MTVLSGGGERSGTDGRSGGSLIGRMAEHQSEKGLRRMKMRRGRCVRVEEGAG